MNSWKDYCRGAAEQVYCVPTAGLIRQLRAQTCDMHAHARMYTAVCLHLRLISGCSGGLRLAGGPPDAHSARQHQWKYAMEEGPPSSSEAALVVSLTAEQMRNTEQQRTSAFHINAAECRTLRADSCAAALPTSAALCKLIMGKSLLKKVCPPDVSWLSCQRREHVSKCVACAWRSQEWLMVSAAEFQWPTVYAWQTDRCVSVCVCVCECVCACWRGVILTSRCGEVYEESMVYPRAPALRSLGSFSHSLSQDGQSELYLCFFFTF